MTFVVDASVAMAGCFADETSPVADVALDRLAHEGAVTPAHWPLEVANALRTAERRGRLSPSDVPRLRALLAALPVEVEPVELSTALHGVLEVARTHDLTPHDAAYLELAAVRSIPLATVDDRLRRACAAAGVELIG